MVTGFELIFLGSTALLLSFTAALLLAGRSLNRRQRRDWAIVSRRSSGVSDVDVTASVEAAFTSMSLARQLALVLLIVQTAHVLGRVQDVPRLPTVLAAALGLYLLFDKLLPYALVGALGGTAVIRLFRPLFVAERLLLAPIAGLLGSLTDRARARTVEEQPDVEGGVLGDFIDLAEEEGLVTESEEALLRGVADFEEAVVRQVMTPRVDIVAIESGAALKDLRKIIAEHRLSRIPVTGGDLDHVVGIAHLKDLVGALEQHDEDLLLATIVRPAWFVPESKRVNELLAEFQRRQTQMAIVVDEYGGTAGLVTLEDAVEEIVGEIQDEDEQPEILIEVDGDSVVASGKAEIEDVEEALGVDIGNGDFHTVGGLVFTRFGHVPAVGECLQHGALLLEVLEADERRIQRVRISSR